MAKKIMLWKKSILKILLYAILSVFILNNLDTVAILKFEKYPKILYYIFILLEFLIFVIALNRIYFEIDTKKHIFLKLFSFSFLIVIIQYCLSYFTQFILYNYFKEYDPNIITYRDLGIVYNGPQFKPIETLIIFPFTQLYIYIKYIALNSLFLLLFSQWIFRCLIISFGSILFKKTSQTK